MLVFLFSNRLFPVLSTGYNRTRWSGQKASIMSLVESGRVRMRLSYLTQVKTRRVQKVFESYGLGWVGSPFFICNVILLQLNS